MNTIETRELNTAPFFQEPTHDEIALAAFLSWESEGRPPGRDMEYWCKAESQLRASRVKKAEAAAAQAALPWPPTTRPTRVVKKPAAARTLTTTTKRTTVPKPAAKRSARAA